MSTEKIQEQTKPKEEKSSNTISCNNCDICYNKFNETTKKYTLECNHSLCISVFKI